MILLTNKQKKLADKYKCDGRCYWKTGMCPRADYCEHTRCKEFIAMMFAVLLIPAVTIAMIILFILYLL